MAPKLNPEYSKMLSTPVPPADGPRKSAIESLQKQIDFYVGETYRLRYAQNSNAAVSCLPSELLAEAFLHIVESGLQGGNTSFAKGTFSFLQVCKHWNEVAVGSPQLWRWWVPGAVKAWSLFNFRSKDAPLSLTWRPRLSISSPDILGDPGIPKRIHQLDFSGTSEQLTHLFGNFDSSSPSNATSIRLQIFPYDDDEPRERLVHFLCSPFPKLSHLNLKNFLLDSSSPIFTTSCLTSLKLSLPYRENHYTLSQFSQILQRHTNLQELNLSRGAMPLPATGQSDPLVPITLPQLVSLRLYGAEEAISGFIDFTGLSSPLHDIAIIFDHSSKPTVPALIGTVEKILVAYYECKELNYPRQVHRLTILCNLEKEHLVFNARSRSTPVPNLRSNLKLQFNGISESAGGVVAKDTFFLLPLDDVREFTAKGPLIYNLYQHRMFEKLKNLSQLRLDKHDLLPTLVTLSPDGLAETDQPIFPKLESLTLYHLDILFDREEDLLSLLKERRDGNVGLKKLVIQSCRVHNLEYRSKLAELVNEVKWDDVEVVGSDYEGTDDELEDESEDYHCHGCRC